MNQNQNNSGKKQRNQRNQKDTKKKEGDEVITSNPAKTKTPTEVKNEEFAPQPQRSNRRTRNEQTTIKRVCDETLSVPEEKKENSDNVAIDHSNLKRETDEIAKLTKKFKKREITSNWNRYSAAEGTVDSQQTVEDTPADFSNLLKVPVSRGGHLLLKEEQEWSEASGAELGGYFALNLKLLSQSLACVPLYEQLRLPKHLFTEDEVNHFDILAEQSKKCYTPDKTEDLGGKSIENAPSMYLNPKTVLNDHHILNGKGNSKSFVNFGVDSENFSNNQSQASDIIEKTASNSPVTVDIKPEVKLEILPVEEKLETQGKQEIIHSNEDKTLEKETFDFSKDTRSIQPSISEFTEKISLSCKNTPDKNTAEYCDKLVKQPVLENNLTPDTITEKIKNHVHNELNINSSTTTNYDCNKDDTDNNESVGNQTKLNTVRELPVKESALNKITDNIKDITLEDDDDLDFLLSLKKPVNTQQTKKEVKPVAVKDTSFVPGGATVTESTSKEQHSDLDQWLDSVLED